MKKVRPIFVWAPIEYKYFDIDAFMKKFSGFFQKMYLENILSSHDKITIIWECIDAKDYGEFKTIGLKDGELITKAGKLPFSFD